MAEDLTETQTEKKVAELAPENWKNPPKLMDLKGDLESSDSAHNAQKQRIDTWLDYLHVRGQAKPKTLKNRSSIQPKLIRKQAEWRYASLSEPFLATDDMFKVEPKTWEDAESARQNMLVLNNQFNTQIDRQALVDDYVRAATDEGTAILKVGWISEEEEYEEIEPILAFVEDEDVTPLMQELMAMEENDPTRFKFDVPIELKKALEETKETGRPMKPLIKDYETVKKTRMAKNHPTIEVCDYDDVIIDPTCKGNFEKASFVIHRFETSLSELEKDGRYKNLDQIMVEQNSSALADADNTMPTPEGHNFRFSDKPRKKMYAYEYYGFWDIDGTGVVKPILATWIGSAMIRMEENPFPDGLPPFVTAQLMPVRNSVYGEPDGELLKDNQQVLGAVMRGMIDIMARSANGQQGSRKDALDVTNKRKFQRGEDYEFNGNVDPRAAFHMHTFPEIPNSAQYMLQLQNFEAESMTGVKAFAQGINSDALGDVVAGIKGVMDAAGKRETGILRRLAKGMTKVARKIIAMNAEFLDDEEVIRVTNKEFVTVRRDDLAGNFDLRLDIATAEEDNVKAQELAFMLQTMGANLDPGMTKLILRDIARLRKMPELAKQIENYEPQPDPMQQQLQQLEMAKLQAEIKKIESEMVENQAEAQYKGAKARETSSSADQKDLDFVEQESGVKQEREKELRGAQAEGNIRLESHKAGLEAGKAALEQDNELATELDKYLAGSIN